MKPRRENNSRRRFLVGIMYAGEAEVDECVRSVENQLDVDIDYFILREMRNVEAHTQLYRKFKESSSRYEFFAKVDADMVLRTTNAFRMVSEIFEDKPSVDHICSTVKDWPSGENIFGIHFFTNRASWPKIDNALMPDPNPIIPGERIFLTEDPAPLALHMPNPDLLQCLLFGYHRALKISQRSSRKKNWKAADLQYSLLDCVARRYRNSTDDRRLAVLAGAAFAFKSNAALLSDKFGDGELKQNLVKYFSEIQKSPRIALSYFEPHNPKRLGIKLKSIFVPRIKENVVLSPSSSHIET